MMRRVPERERGREGEGGERERAKRTIITLLK